MQKKRIIALITALIFIFSCSNAYALSLQDLLNRQKQIERNKTSLQNKIDNIEDQKDTVEGQLDKINQQIDGVQKNLNSINSKLVDNKVKLETVNKELNAATKKAEEQRKVFESRMKVYYTNGNVSYLEIILSSGSFADLISKVEILKTIVGYDKNVLDQMEAVQKEIQTKKADLIATNQIITSSKQEYEQTKKQFDSAKAEKNKLMSKLTEEQRIIEKQYEEEEEQSYKIAEEIQKAQGKTKTTPYSGGKLAWPTPSSSRITSAYGMRFHPILKTNKMHTGIDIGVGSGNSVIAANDGTVIGASYMGGYGYTVIIDHGGGISTLYAHNSALLVSVGQKVKRGQTVSRSGSTGNSTGPHLHFEVRKNGNPVDPMGYFK